MIAVAVLAVTIILTPAPEPAPLPMCAPGEEAQPFEDGYVCGPADPAIPELMDGLEQGGPAPHPMPTFTSGPAPAPDPTAEPPAGPTPEPTPTVEMQLPLPAPYVEDEPRLLAETGPADLTPLAAAGGLLVLLGGLLTRIGRRSA